VLKSEFLVRICQWFPSFVNNLGGILAVKLLVGAENLTSFVTIIKSKGHSGLDRKNVLLTLNFGNL